MTVSVAPDRREVRPNESEGIEEVLDRVDDVRARARGKCITLSLLLLQVEMPKEKTEIGDARQRT